MNNPCTNTRYLIIGAGVAGFSAADRIRELDPSARITMITEEREYPYLRPLLSKTWFRSFHSEKTLLAPADWYREQRIELRTGLRVIKINSREQTALLADGEAISYDCCIYALGARSFIPPIPGRDKEGVYTIRSVSDFNQIRMALALAEKAVVIGGGVVNIELAAELSRMGLKVTMLEAADRVLSRSLDPQSAEVLHGRIRDAGIDLHCNVKIKEITGSDKVESVTLADGGCYAADLVVISCGIRPETELARESHLPCSRGILVNEYLQTQAPSIFAAGDCIEGSQPNPGLWNFARLSGEIAGENAYRQSRGEELIPFHPQAEPLILNTMGMHVFSLGQVTEGESVTTKVTSSEKAAPCLFPVNTPLQSGPAYQKLFYRDDRLVGAILIGDLAEAQDLAALIQAKPSS